MEQLNELVAKLEQAHSERLLAVVLYGSAAVGDHHGKFSDLNVLCVLKQIGPRELAHSEPIFRWWRKQGNPSPLLMSEEEVFRSADSFPIEFHDMQERRRVLYGPDVIAGLKVDRTYHRAQVEHELRAKLFRLRQHAAGVLSDPGAVLKLCLESVSTFLVLGRHLLMLAGQGAKWHKRDIAAQLAAALAIDVAPFETLLDVREGKKEPREVDPARLFEQYLESIRAMVEYVDKLEEHRDL